MQSLSHLIIAGFLSLSMTCSADPFYPTEPQEEPNTPVSDDEQAGKTGKSSAKIHENVTACLPKNINRVSLPMPLSQLKFIGVAEINQQFRALFVGEKGNIIDLRIDDFIDSEFIQIIEINLKSVRYIDWIKSRNCNTPQMVTLKL